MPRPLILIHGYSASSSAYDTWKKILVEHGYAESDLHVINYQSLTNDITITDLAEGFERALSIQVKLDRDEDFDAIVHSTGMLVIRAWLSAYAERRDRLRHLIGLAPASFGSPLAHKGRGMLGALFRGNRQAGPDFLEAGDLILDGLELGSAYTWNLAEQDLLGEETFYGATRSTPFVFTFCGAKGYDFPLSVANSPGSDGTVRMAGCALNTRKIIIDLTKERGRRKRTWAAPWSNADIPVIPMANTNHATIMSRPNDDLIATVMGALEVDSEKEYEAWLIDARNRTKKVRNNLERWQQVIFRLVDERGDPVPDYFIEFITCAEDDTVWQPVKQKFEDFDVDVHVYSSDPSFRCFHIDIGSANIGRGKVGLRLIAPSGTDLLGYHGYVQNLDIAAPEGGTEVWDGVIDLSNIRRDVTFFKAFTTTLVEIRLNREPLPLKGVNKLVNFEGSEEARAARTAEEFAEKVRRREARLDELEEWLKQGS